MEIPKNKIKYFGKFHFGADIKITRSESANRKVVEIINFMFIFLLVINSLYKIMVIHYLITLIQRPVVLEKYSLSYIASACTPGK